MSRFTADFDIPAETRGFAGATLAVDSAQTSAHPLLFGSPRSRPWADPRHQPWAARAADVTATFDRRGVLVAVSDECHELLGFEPGELVGAHPLGLLHPDDRSSLAPATRAFVSGITDHLHSIQRVRHKSGGYTLLESAVRSTAASPLERPAGAVAVVRPAELSQPTPDRPALSLATTAIGTAYAWVMHGSRRAVIASADPLFATLLETTTARLCGQSLDELTDPGDPATGRARIEAMLGGSGSSIQLERPVAGGRGVVELTVSLLPLEDKPGRVAVIQARDLGRQHATDRAAERALRDSLSRLERSNRRLEAFASVAAHDLAAPLRAVVGYAEILERQDEPLSPEIGRLLEKVASTSRRMQAQVDGLMMLARHERDELVVSMQDIGQLVDEALEALALEITESGARVDVGKLPRATCNATGIVQVFQNLLANALKYARGTPHICVRAEMETDAWRFSVLDRGIGLSECDQERLFELFERGGAPRTASGAGIGLAVCKQIIERHGGRIWCKPRPGGGAEFHFTVPIDGEKSDPSRAGHVRNSFTYHEHHTGGNSD